MKPKAQAQPHVPRKKVSAPADAKKDDDITSSYRTSLYANRAKLMNTNNGRHARPASIRRNSFSSTRDIGKDNALTSKEKFFGKILHKLKLPGHDHDSSDEESDDEECHRHFNLRHLFTREDSDPYAATYAERQDSTTLGDAMNLFVCGNAMAFNR